jgi:putative membrane protein
MNRILLASTAVALLWSANPALGQQGQPPQNSPQGQQQQSQLSQQDRQFVQQAWISNQFEIQAAEIAKGKAGNQPIQRFAQRMVDDHKMVGDQLTNIVKPLNVQVPQQLDDQHRQRIEKLKGLSGREFAPTYVQGQVDAHQQAVSLFEKQSNEGQNQELKKFASDTLPTLREHLKSAQDLQKETITTAGTSRQTGPQDQQPAADVTVHQPPAQVTVKQPEPEVTVQ